MRFPHVVINAKAAGIERPIGKVITQSTRAVDLETAMAKGIGRKVGESNLPAILDGIYCPQTADHVVEVCQKALQEQKYDAIKEAFPGCLTTSKTSMKTLQLHIEATPAKKPATAAAAAAGA